MKIKWENETKKLIQKWVYTDGTVEETANDLRRSRSAKDLSEGEIILLNEGWGGDMKARAVLKETAS